MKKAVYSLGLGITGGALGNYLDIPLGWLLGAMVANMVASMQGLSVEVPNWLRTLALMALGVMLGTAFSPELLERIHRWALTMTGMICYLAIAVPWAMYYGRKVTGFDRLTAIFSSIPGGLSFMVILGSSVGANPRTIALAHTARLVTILIVLPIIVNRLANNRAGTLVNVVDTNVKVYDASKHWRDRAIKGMFHSGRLVRDPRSRRRTTI